MRKVLVLMMIVSLVTSPSSVLAEDVFSPGKPNGKSAEKMPVLGSPYGQGYEAAKKAIEEADKKGEDPPSFKEKAHQLVVLAAKALRVNPQRGDPKTDFSQGENRLHSEKQTSPSIRSRGRVDLTNWRSSSTFYSGATYSVTYNYQPSAKNPFQSVVVVYDTATRSPLSATGYLTTNLSEAPDLSGMTLVSEAYHSDSTLAYQKYESEPTRTGSTTQVTLYYDSLGTFSYATQTLVQPLDLKKVKFPV